MQGVEYIVLHAQEPILYVIRKQHRSSQTQATPLADFYILAGVVYQAPDLQSVINSRLTSSVHHLVSAFDEAMSYMRYHPTKGYCWEFGAPSSLKSNQDKAKERVKNDTGSVFQRRRVDLLLGELSRKFPPKVPAADKSDAAAAAGDLSGKAGSGEAAATSASASAQRPEKREGDVGQKRPQPAELGPPSKVLRSS